LLRFLLDNQILGELPLGWDDLDTTLRVERTLLYLRLQVVDAKFTFYRDGYRYLFDKWQSGCCNEVKLTIEEDPSDNGNWAGIYVGIIKLPAADWSFEPDQVTVAVEDASWFAYLNNNKGVEVPTDLTLTKNGLPITPPSVHAITFTDPDPTTPGTETRDMYYLDELLSYMISYLSDNEVGFASTDLGPTGIFAGYAIQTGYRLRTGLTDQGIIQLKLTDILDELNKNFHLGAALEFSGSKPIFRVEQESYFRNRTTSVVLDEIHPIRVITDVARLYSTVRAGSETTVPQGGILQFPESTRWRGFADEQFYLLGQCNLDNELNLLRGWVVSSNAIEDSIFNSQPDNDDQIFLVEIDRGTGMTVQDNWLTPTPGAPLFFNPNLTNESTVMRWLDGIPASLASELGNIPSGQFNAITRVVLTPATVTESSPTNYMPRVMFDDDFSNGGFDQGDVYGNGTPQGSPVSQSDSRFTAPVSGAYDLTTQVLLNVKVLAGSTINELDYWANLRMRRYNASNVLVDEYITPLTYIDFEPYYTLNSCEFTSDVSIQIALNLTEVGVPMDATDYMEIRVDIQSDGIYSCLAPFTPTYTIETSVLAGSFFSCTQSPDFGNFTQTVNCETASNILLKFRAPLNRQDLTAILNNPSYAIGIRTQERIWTGWVEQLKFNHDTSLADITLLTSKSLLP